VLTVAINEGINSTVVVTDNGKVVFALQEERIRRNKNFIGFPHQALAFAFDYLNIKPDDIDCVCFSNMYSPLDTKESFLAWYDATADANPRSVIEGDLKNLTRRLYNQLPLGVVKLRNMMANSNPNQVMLDHLAVHGLSGKEIKRYHHHLNHAAAAYFGLRKNPEEPHLVLTLDGGGDHVCSHVYIAERGQLRLIASTPNGHSVGNIYSRVTHFMGLTPHEHEYKLMGLAAYTKEDYSKKAFQVFKSYLDLDPTNPLVFQCKIPEMTTGVQTRLDEDLKRIRFDNIAGGLQQFTEDLLLRWVKAAVEQTRIRKVLVSGGVFMNVKANALISNLDEVEFFDVFPSCGDESLPFGAAWLHYAESSPTNGDDIEFSGCYLGPEADYDFAAAKERFANQLHYYKLNDTNKVVARLLARGDIVARCSGKMEFGARALGNRSILADADDYQVIPTINKMIKNRDFWMPFAPAILLEEVEKYIMVPRTLPPDRISPHMMITFNSKVGKGQSVAAIHPYDRTARAQIVARHINPEFHDLMYKFHALTGKGLILNTSFNLHGFPIVMGAIDAMDVMVNSALEYLVIGDHLISKRPLDNPELLKD
jgi:carbamoyltransferase